MTDVCNAQESRIRGSAWPSSRDVNGRRRPPVGTRCKRQASEYEAAAAALLGSPCLPQGQAAFRRASAALLERRQRRAADSRSGRRPAQSIQAKDACLALYAANALLEVEDVGRL